MKIINISLAAAILATISFAEENTSTINTTVNVAVTSNYVWRGMTRSDDSTALQGGFDTKYKGLYVGAWASNVDFAEASDASMEYDAYGGFSSDIAGVGYDVGFIQYYFPDDKEALNFAESYLGLSYAFEKVKVSAKYNLGVKTDEIQPEDAYEASLMFPFPNDIRIDATLGEYEETGTYYLIGLSRTVKKFDVGIAYSVMDYENINKEKEENFIGTVSARF